MSLMLATASSTGLVTSVSTASGLAPGYDVLTTTMGKSRAGRRSTPSFVHDTRPMTSSAQITISMKSGRRIATFVSHITLCSYVRAFARSRVRVFMRSLSRCSGSHLAGSASWPHAKLNARTRERANGSSYKRRRRLHLRGDDVAVGQVAEAAGGNQLSIVDSAQDLGELVTLQAQLDRLAVYAAVFVDGDDHRRRTGRPAQDGGPGHHQRVVLLGGDDVEPREHARPQLVGLVLRLDTHRRRATLAIDRRRDRLHVARERLRRECRHLELDRLTLGDLAELAFLDIDDQLERRRDQRHDRRLRADERASRDEPFRDRPVHRRDD